MPGGPIIPILSGLLVAIGLIYRPGRTAGILLFLAPLIWAFGSADGEGKGASGLTLVAVVSGLLTLLSTRWLLRPVGDPHSSWVRRAAIFYCLATLPSVFVSPALTRSAGGYLRLICPVLFLFLLWHSSQRRLLQAFQFRALVLSPVVMIAVVGLAYYTGQNKYYMGGFDRLRAFNLSPQHISLYSVALLGVLLSGVLLAKQRWPYLLAIGPLLFFTYLTGYRTAWAGLILLVAIVTVLAVRSGLTQFTALILAISLAAFAGTIVKSFARYAPSDEGVNGDVLNSITSGRIQTDRVALDRYLAGTPTELLFGFGVYSSENITLEGEGTGYAVHDDYLATLVECGFMGLLAYFLLIAAIGWALVRRMRSLHSGDPLRTLTAVAFASYVAFMIMGIPSALYTNVFIGLYYYGFLGFVLGQAPHQRTQSLRAADQVRSVSVAGRVLTSA